MEFENIDFFGEYAHALDAQRRVSIPSAWRPKSESLDFYVLRLADGQVELRLRSGMQQFLENARKLSLNDVKKQRELALFTSKIVQVKMDKQGRLQLPQEACNHAGIKDQVVLIGTVCAVQVWSPEKWTAYQNEAGDAFNDTIEAIGAPAEEVVHLKMEKHHE